MDFPEQTAEIIVRGFLRIGYLTKPEEMTERQRELHAIDLETMRLYFFVGDYAAGESFELWLTAEEASSRELLRVYDD